MLVEELFDKVLPRMTDIDKSSGMTFLDAVDKVADIFFNRLHTMKSSIIREQFSGVAVLTRFVTMPSDFRGFADKPYLTDSSGYNHTLISVTSYTNTMPNQIGTEPPVYFDLVGPFKVEFTPQPTADSGEYSETYTLGGFYYSHPGTFEMVDYLPWDELYDMEFEEGVLIALSLGTTDSRVVSKIADLVDQQEANRVVRPRRNKLWL